MLLPPRQPVYDSPNYRSPLIVGGRMGMVKTGGYQAFDAAEKTSCRIWKSPHRRIQ
jgi:hypothetical protein